MRLALRPVPPAVLDILVAFLLAIAAVIASASWPKPAHAVDGLLGPVIDYVREIQAVPTVDYAGRVIRGQIGRQSIRYQTAVFWPIAGVSISGRFLYLEAAPPAINHLRGMAGDNSGIWIPAAYLGFGRTFMAGRDGKVFIGTEFGIYTRPFVGASIRLF